MILKNSRHLSLQQLMGHPNKSKTFASDAEMDARREEGVAKTSSVDARRSI
jgi:hypothetical protein